MTSVDADQEDKLEREAVYIQVIITVNDIRRSKVISYQRWESIVRV